MLDLTHPCGLDTSTAYLTLPLCVCEAVVQPTPALLLLTIATLGSLRALLCKRPHPAPKHLYRRDKSLWIGALVCATLAALASLASLLLALLLPIDWPSETEAGSGPVLDRGKAPPAWLLSPFLEFAAACVCILIVAHTRDSARPRARSSWRAVAGLYALLQALATIVVMMLTSEAAPGFLLILTLCRVGACCALALTALWPNRSRAVIGAGAEGSWEGREHDSPLPASHNPSLATPMAQALLRQVDDAASDAAAHRRNQRDVWAEWLTYSSAQIAGMAAPRPDAPQINTTNGSTISSCLDGHSPRITHDSEQRDSGIPYTIAYDSNSASASGSCHPSPHVSRGATLNLRDSPERHKPEMLPPAAGGPTAHRRTNSHGREGFGGGPTGGPAGGGPAGGLIGGGGPIPVGLHPAGLGAAATAPSVAVLGGFEGAAGPSLDAVPPQEVEAAAEAALSPPLVSPGRAASSPWPPRSSAHNPFHNPFDPAVTRAASDGASTPGNPFDAPSAAPAAESLAAWPPPAPASTKQHQRTNSNGSNFSDFAFANSEETSSTSSANQLPYGVAGGGAAFGGSDGAPSNSTTARSTATRPTADGHDDSGGGLWSASGGHAASAHYTSGEERWTEPLVEAEILGHMWVPDMDSPESGEMHLEYMLKTVGDEQYAGARLVQRRYRDFEKLAAALAPFARRTNTSIAPLPSNLTFGRKLSAEFAAQRQAALQTWLTKIVARPPLWCDALRLFLGLAEEAGDADSNDGAEDAKMHSGALVVLDGDSNGGGSGQQYAEELRWIAQRALQPGCGVPMDGSSYVSGAGKDTFRASTLVKWLATQALVTSREQAVPLGEAMRRQGLIALVQPLEGGKFADGPALYRFANSTPP